MHHKAEITRQTSSLKTKENPPTFPMPTPYAYSGHSHPWQSIEEGKQVRKKISYNFKTTRNSLGNLHTRGVHTQFVGLFHRPPLDAPRKDWSRLDTRKLSPDTELATAARQTCNSKNM